MKNKSCLPQQVIRKIITIWLFMCILLPAAVLANGGQSALEGLQNSAHIGYGSADMPVESLPGTIGRMIGAILAFVGVVFFVLMIYGGFVWMTARGNEQQVAKAKNLIGSAVIGLIIVLAAYGITAFLGESLVSN